LLERYFEGADNARGRPLGKVVFKPETLHDMRMVSKSIVALLYGIALNRGNALPPEAPLFSSFPEYADLAREGRERLTIHHPHGHGHVRAGRYRPNSPVESSCEQSKNKYQHDDPGKPANEHPALPRAAQLDIGAPRLVGGVGLRRRLGWTLAYHADQQPSAR
jgi:hypothetical protein